MPNGITPSARLQPAIPLACSLLARSLSSSLPSLYLPLCSDFFVLTVPCACARMCCKRGRRPSRPALSLVSYLLALHVYSPT